MGRLGVDGHVRALGNRAKTNPNFFLSLAATANGKFLPQTGGVLIKDGADSMEEFPWLLIFPGLILATTLFSLNFLGDGLRDALDVRASKD